MEMSISFFGVNILSGWYVFYALDPNKSGRQLAWQESGILSGFNPVTLFLIPFSECISRGLIPIFAVG